MTFTDKRLCAGVLSASEATLYTSPAGIGYFTIIKAITLCNTSSSVVGVTLSFNGITLVASYSLLPNDTITIPFMDQIINQSEVIEGYASVSSVVAYYMSGKEVVS